MSCKRVRVLDKNHCGSAEEAPGAGGDVPDVGGNLAKITRIMSCSSSLSWCASLCILAI
jgi:hypothetical protein